MHCPDHKHNAWPQGGKHQLLIEACETHCGWCDYKTKKGAANNLRSVRHTPMPQGFTQVDQLQHARAHKRNPKYAMLRDIEITQLRAGRSRIAMRSSATASPPLEASGFTSLRLHSESSITNNDSESHEGSLYSQLVYQKLWLQRRVEVLEDLLRHFSIPIPSPLHQEPHPSLRSMEQLYALHLTQSQPTAACTSPIPRDQQSHISQHKQTANGLELQGRSRQIRGTQKLRRLRNEREDTSFAEPLHKSRHTRFILPMEHSDQYDTSSVSFDSNFTVSDMSVESSPPTNSRSIAEDDFDFFSHPSAEIRGATSTEYTRFLDTHNAADDLMRLAEIATMQ